MCVGVGVCGREGCVCVVWGCVFLGVWSVGMSCWLSARIELCLLFVCVFCCCWFCFLCWFFFLLFFFFFVLCCFFFFCWCVCVCVCVYCVCVLCVCVLGVCVCVCVHAVQGDGTNTFFLNEETP